MQFVGGLVLSFLLTAQSFAQTIVTVQARKVYAISGLVNPRLSGTIVLTDDLSKLVSSEAAEVSVTTEAKSVSVLAFRSMLEPPAILVKGDKGLYGFTGNGSFAIWVIANDPETGQGFAFTNITLGVAPVPPGPIPPGPDPSPDDKPPIPDPGFRALIIYESDDLDVLPKEQLNIFYAKAIRDYLNSKCIRVNGMPEWRVSDKDLPTLDSKALATAMQRPRKSLPWLIVSNGKRGFEGALPADSDKTLALLKKYGEQ